MAGLDRCGKSRLHRDFFYCHFRSLFVHTYIIAIWAWHLYLYIDPFLLCVDGYCVPTWPVVEGTFVVKVALSSYVCTCSHGWLCSPCLFWCQWLFLHGRHYCGMSRTVRKFATCLFRCERWYSTTSTSIFSRNPSALAGFVIGVFLLCKTHIWWVAIILLCVFEEATDSSEDVLAIRVGCSLGPFVAFLLCGFASVSSWRHFLHILSFGVWVCLSDCIHCIGPYEQS